MRFRAALMMGALLVVTTAGAVFGQGFQGGLRGSVKDSGGVIPGVEVTLVNEQTNINRSTVTNERGEYAFRLVSYKGENALESYEKVLPVAPLLVAVAYYAGAQAGFLLTPSAHPVSPLWPPNAILFGALLLAFCWFGFNGGSVVANTGIFAILASIPGP